MCSPEPAAALGRGPGAGARAVRGRRRGQRGARRAAHARPRRAMERVLRR